jgi:hypothetical protein
MGVYADHGVEYHVTRKGSHAHIAIAPMARTDDRLLESKYYKARKGTWFDGVYRGSFTRKIEDADFDVQLTEAEQAWLDELLSAGDVVEHGWYEVNVLSSTH